MYTELRRFESIFTYQKVASCKFVDTKNSSLQYGRCIPYIVCRVVLQWMGEERTDWCDSKYNE